jgi:two-component system nitrogen regulation response regulator GlnG
MQASPTLLIIEDDPDNARSVEEAAQDAGFSTRCAATGLAGVEAFQQQVPDLVLSDLVLPDIDGLQVLARLRKLDAAVPVIIMTAYGSVESGVARHARGRLRLRDQTAGTRRHPIQTAPRL